MTDSPSIQYDTNTPESWIKAVESWKWYISDEEPTVTIYRIEGNCPRCSGQMHREIPVVTALGFAWRGSGNNLPPTVEVACNCETKHQNQSEGHTTGCGQHGSIRVNIPDMKGV